MSDDRNDSFSDRGNKGGMNNKDRMNDDPSKSKRKVYLTR